MTGSVNYKLPEYPYPDLSDDLPEGFADTPRPTTMLVEFFPTDIVDPDEGYSTPERTAEIAHAKADTYQYSEQYVSEYLAQRQHDSPVLQRLQVIVAQTDHAVAIMTGIGYTNFRHLIACGFTLPEISSCIGLNTLDLMAFMSSHPDAETHAEIDMTLCADTKMLDMIQHIKDAPMESKFEGDKLKQLVYATEILCKRLSSKWVGMFKQSANQANGVEGGLQAGLTINMNLGNSNMSGPLHMVGQDTTNSITGQSTIPAVNMSAVKASTSDNGRTLDLDLIPEDDY